MNQPAQMQIAAAPAQSSILRTTGAVLLGTLFLAACAHIALPLYFTPVPLTVQPFGVLVLGLLMGPRTAFATLVAYLAEGALGLPVFAPSTVALTGIAHLFGPTAGYLLAYPAAAALISHLWRRSRRSFGSALASAAAGDALILATGAAWLAVWTAGTGHWTPATIFTQAILPFLPGEALKIAAGAGIAAGASRLRRSN